MKITFIAAALLFQSLAFAEPTEMIQIFNSHRKMSFKNAVSTKEPLECRVDNRPYVDCKIPVQINNLGGTDLEDGKHVLIIRQKTDKKVLQKHAFILDTKPPVVQWDQAPSTLNEGEDAIFKIHIPGGGK